MHFQNIHFRFAYLCKAPFCVYFNDSIYYQNSDQLMKTIDLIEKKDQSVKITLFLIGKELVSYNDM